MNINDPMLANICPALAYRIIQLVWQSSEPVRIIAGFRDWEAQAALWAQGRTSGGPIVTDARPGASWHEFGLAVDLGIIRLLSEPGWAPSDPAWAQMGELGKSLGLFWGGDFVHNPDRPHFQLTGSWPEVPTDAARQMFQTQGMNAVWQAGGLRK
jgi:peptidoglycan LD-endopeptidase CwlK